MLSNGFGSRSKMETKEVKAGGLEPLSRHWLEKEEEKLNDEEEGSLMFHAEMCQSGSTYWKLIGATDYSKTLKSTMSSFTRIILYNMTDKNHWEMPNTKCHADSVRNGTSRKSLSWTSVTSCVPGISYHPFKRHSWGPDRCPCYQPR